MLSAPEYVREIVAQWGATSRPAGADPAGDLLLDSLYTLLKLMRLAYEDGEDWLTEQLEYQRQEIAAHAVCASEDRGLRPVG